jgi:hypothetical protein
LSALFIIDVLEKVLGNLVARKARKMESFSRRVLQYRIAGGSEVAWAVRGSDPGCASFSPCPVSSMRVLGRMCLVAPRFCGACFFHGTRMSGKWFPEAGDCPERADDRMHEAFSRIGKSISGRKTAQVGGWWLLAFGALAH